MRKLQIFLIVFGSVLLASLYFEGRYQMISSYLQGDMTEQEKADYVEQLRDGMQKQQERITLVYRGDREQLEDFVMDSINAAYAIDREDTSSDYDYMRYIHKQSNINMSGIGNRYTVTYEMEYLETSQQTEEVDRKVKKVLKKLVTEKMSDFEKVKAVHDYIIDQVNYDTTAKNNSPYSALIKQSSACQGYATLTYKMLTELGIPSRVITGKSNKGVLHAWNLVQVDGKWYHLDTTWDDPSGIFGKGSVRYRYFLKADSDMTDHIRDEEFTTLEFTQAYPVAPKSYQP